ncbi:hypothetical protein QAD02_004146 [Eretmocerus hayati]|uniref:Uncharacterized protein n=1 Tax=Eretmocerus hayati TaxID=131215 RepID=A0ACC2NTL3_9HYME|nr:hypothetical protein QAD02_004146 [Eretmocerus hayati]
MMTGGGPAHSINTSDEALVTMVHKLKPTLDFTLENDWDSTAAFEESVDLTADNDVVRRADSHRLNFVVDDVIDLLDDERPNSDDKQSRMHDDFDDSDLKCQASTSQNMQNVSCCDNLMIERKETLANRGGFCKPAAASYKNKKSAVCKSEKNSTPKNDQNDQVVRPMARRYATPLLKRNNAKPKLTTSQKLGRQMRMWGVSLAQSENMKKEDDVPKTNCKSGILSNRIRKCQENIDSDDERPSKKRKVCWAQVEQAEKIQRAEGGRQQQAEFYKARMEVIAREKIYWDIKIEVIDLEKQLLVKQIANSIVAAYSKEKSSDELNKP